jgi:ketosteroid isomerase-like protein
MSKHVALVREVAADWNGGGWNVSPEAFHPEVEFLPLRSSVEGPYRGIAGVESFVADTLEVFETFEFDVEYEDLGDQVLAWGSIHVRAKGSGLETDVPTGGLFSFRDGKIVRFEDFGSKAAALKAAEVG